MDRLDKDKKGRDAELDQQRDQDQFGVVCVHAVKFTRVRDAKRMADDESLCGDANL